MKRCPNPSLDGRTARSRSARCSRPRTSADASPPQLRSRTAARRCGCTEVRSEARGGVACGGDDGVIGGGDGYRHTSRDRRGLADRVGAAHRRPRAHRARRRAGRGAGAGRARRRARAVAGVGRPGQPGRLAHGHRQAPRDRPAAPRQACSSASTRSSAASSRPEQETAVRRARGGARRRHRRRPAAPRLHRLPPGALDRGARRAHAAPARRPDHRRDRARLPRPGADRRAAHRARQADARRGARPVRGAARRRAAPRAWRRCSRSSTSIFNEGYSATAGDDWMRPGALRGRAAPRPHPGRAGARTSPRSTASSR